MPGGKQPTCGYRFHLAAIYTDKGWRIECIVRRKELKIGLANREIAHGFGSPTIYEQRFPVNGSRYSPQDSFLGIGCVRQKSVQATLQDRPVLQPWTFLNAYNNVRGDTIR